MPSASPAPVREMGYQTDNTAWWAENLEATPELRWPQSTAVYDKMRRQDSQVASVLRAVTLPVRRTGWRIDSASARDEVTEFIADDLGLPIMGGEASRPVLRTRDRFSWPEHLRQALLMLPYGHMFFEQVYRIDEAGYAHLRKLAPRMPRTLAAIHVAGDGGLDSIEQFKRQGNPNTKIPVSRLVAYVHDLEGANWTGNSLLRPAYKHWMLKDRLLRVQAQTIERNGMGVPRYTGPENPKDAAVDLERGLDLAKGWRSGEAAGASIPYGAKLDLVGVTGTLPDAEKAIRYHDEQIARAVLAHFLNLGTQTGSWALGTTFADFFVASLQTLAEQIADVVTQHVIEDIVDINFGETEPAPRLVFDEIGSRRDATAAAIKALVDAGAVVVDRQLEEFLRTAYGLPSKGGDTENLDEPTEAS